MRLSASVCSGNPQSHVGIREFGCEPRCAYQGLAERSRGWWRKTRREPVSQFFRVQRGGRARGLFQQPDRVGNIFSRVTGNNASNLAGRLGVLGTANLFLLNPNGIIFGPNASLDVAGSFTASTASSLLMADGTVYSATSPTASSLLTVSVPLGVQFGKDQPKATITNRGNLSTGQDLTLEAGSLDLQGQLQAGNNLTLKATDTVKIRDTVTEPFVARSGGKMLIQGNQAVDIFALNHAASGLFSGGDMVLRSASTIGGDAHYYTEGSFRIETLNGSAGSLFSPYDPIIRSSGDVTFDNYTGASLHIFAGGSVTISGKVKIIGAANDPLQPNEVTVQLSNPVGDLASPDRLTSVTTNSSTESILDIRAGVTETELGTPGLTPIPFPGASNTINPNSPASTGQGSRADITIGSIGDCDPFCSSGLIFLTNQYQPNQSPGVITVAGAIVNPAGLTVIDSRGDITVSGGINGSSAFTSGRTIQLLSGRDIKTGKSVSTGSTEGNGGFVIFHAFRNIKTGDVRTDAGNGSITGKPNGNISIVSKTGSIQTIGTVTSFAVQGDAGNITLYAEKDIITGSDAVSGLGLGGIESILSSTGRGKSGTITVTSNNGTIDTRIGPVSSKSDDGFAGDIILKAAKDIKTSSITASSNSDVNNTISLFNDEASSTILLESSQGSVKIGEAVKAPQLTTTNFGTGFSGDIVINAANEIQITNNSRIESLGNQGFVLIGNSNGTPFRSFLSNLTPSNITVKDSSINTTNDKVVNQFGGKVFINGTNLTISGSGSQVLAEGKDGAIAGDVRIIANKLTVTDKAQVSVNSSGVAGSLLVFADQVFLNQGTLSTNIGKASPDGNPSANIFLLGKDSANNDPTASLLQAVALKESPQNINNQLSNGAITPLSFLIMENGSKITATASGDASGGNIFIKTQVLLAPKTGNKIQANAGVGNGGNIFIFAKPLGIYNIEFRSTGTTTLNDITATSLSGANGIVDITIPDINPARGLNQLAIDVADASKKIAIICPIAGQQGAANQFVVTGRGGLPETPASALGSNVLVGEQAPVATQPNAPQPDLTQPSATAPNPAANATKTPSGIEAQGVERGANGDFILTAQASSVDPHPSWQPFQRCVQP